MGIRLRTLWRVPVFCLAAGYISFYITVCLGHFFYVVKTVGADGVLELSLHPVRLPVWHGALFVLFLLVGGLWCFRSMTKAEIALSAVIAVALYLAVTIPELIVPGCLYSLSLSLTVTLMKLDKWTSGLYYLLYTVTGQIGLSAVVSSFAPLLFIPFGKNAGRPVSAAP